jgi:hypothetical protein
MTVPNIAYHQVALLNCKLFDRGETIMNTYIPIVIVSITLFLTLGNLLQFIICAVIRVEEDKVDGIQGLIFLYGLGTAFCLYLAQYALILIILAGYLENTQGLIINGLRSSYILALVLCASTYFAYRKTKLLKPFLHRKLYLLIQPVRVLSYS